MVQLRHHAIRRLAVVGLALAALLSWLILNPANYQPTAVQAEVDLPLDSKYLAANILAALVVQPHYTETKYSRSDFYSNWSNYNGCDMRNVILQRDLTDTALDGCIVLSGKLQDPYTGDEINFIRGAATSGAVQIDHVVALSNAWQTGAANLAADQRHALSQDPLNLLAVDGPTNQKKSDQDAAAWLPPNTAFRCQYVARQISVKYKYILWVTPVEKTAMSKTLENCPDQPTLGLENPPS